MDISFDIGTILLFFFIGLVAQMIHGSIGMAYGTIAATALLIFGIPPAATSTATHVAKIFANGASGFSHWSLGNVDRRMLLMLLIPGILGGAVGAVLLTNLSTEIGKTLLSVYLIAMGLLVLSNAIQFQRLSMGRRRLVPLGAAGGFLDALGGSGWGPIVTSNLLATKDQDIKQCVGTSNMAHFGVAVAITLMYTGVLSVDADWSPIIGLVSGAL
ncbi:MAG: hypothetical protein CUN54_06330, partial [Phototrophicales bacterium]